MMRIIDDEDGHDDQYDDDGDRPLLPLDDRPFKVHHTRTADSGDSRTYFQHYNKLLLMYAQFHSSLYCLWSLCLMCAQFHSSLYCLWSLCLMCEQFHSSFYCHTMEPLSDVWTIPQQLLLSYYGASVWCVNNSTAAFTDILWSLCLMCEQFHSSFYCHTMEPLSDVWTIPQQLLLSYYGASVWCVNNSTAAFTVILWSLCLMYEQFHSSFYCHTMEPLSDVWTIPQQLLLSYYGASVWCMNNSTVAFTVTLWSLCLMYEQFHSSFYCHTMEPLSDVWTIPQQLLLSYYGASVWCMNNSTAAFTVILWSLCLMYEQFHSSFYCHTMEPLSDVWTIPQQPLLSYYGASVWCMNNSTAAFTVTLWSLCLIYEQFHSSLYCHTMEPLSDVCTIPQQLLLSHYGASVWCMNNSTAAFTVILWSLCLMYEQFHSSLYCHTMEPLSDVWTIPQ